MPTSLPKYVPLESCIDRGIYALRSRNLATGVFRRRTSGFIGIRHKFFDSFLFEEYHWDTGEPYGTACPVRLIGILPDDIANSYYDAPPGCHSWGLRGTEMIGVVRTNLAPGEEPHGRRRGFQDRWVDTGERTPDDLIYSDQPENQKLFDYLNEISH